MPQTAGAPWPTVLCSDEVTGKGQEARQSPDRGKQVSRLARFERERQRRISAESCRVSATLCFPPPWNHDLRIAVKMPPRAGESARSQTFSSPSVRKDSRKCRAMSTNKLAYTNAFVFRWSDIGHE